MKKLKLYQKLLVVTFTLFFLAALVGWNQIQNFRPPVEAQTYFEMMLGPSLGPFAPISCAGQYPIFTRIVVAIVCLGLLMLSFLCGRASSKWAYAGLILWYIQGCALVHCAL